MGSLVTLLVIVLKRIFPSVESAPGEWWKRRRSSGWAVVQGRIQESVADHDEDFWFADISYSYEVNGEYYSGFDKQLFTGERAANEYAERFPIGTVIFVRYNPRQPGASVMLRDDQMGLGAHAPW